MKKVLLFSLIALLCGALGAQSITLDYVDGSVDVRTGTNTWASAREGLKLAPEAVLRVSGGGAAELTAPTSKIHLAKDGVYQLKDLLATAKAPDTNVASLASKALDRMLTGKTGIKASTATMGARAAEANSVQLAWAGDDDAAPDPLSVLARARALATQGRPAAALKVLRDGKVPSTDPDYWASLVLTGTQALEVQDADLALTATSAALGGPIDLETRQTVLVTQALAHRLQKNSDKAKALLAESVKLDPQSATGQEAARLLAP